MSEFAHLAQWAQPDGDNDELEDIRLDVRTLLTEYSKSQKRLNWITNRFVGMKWVDMPGSLAYLKPEDEKYVSEKNLFATIDKRTTQ